MNGQSFYRKLLIRHKIDPINKCFTTCVVTSWVHGKKDWTWKMWKRGDLKWRKFGDVLASDHLFPNLPPLFHLSSFKIGPSGIFYWNYCLEHPCNCLTTLPKSTFCPKRKNFPSEHHMGSEKVWTWKIIKKFEEVDQSWVRKWKWKVVGCWMTASALSLGCNMVERGAAFHRIAQL